MENKGKLILTNLHVVSNNLSKQRRIIKDHEAQSMWQRDLDKHRSQRALRSAPLFWDVTGNNRKGRYCGNKCVAHKYVGKTN